MKILFVILLLCKTVCLACADPGRTLTVTIIPQRAISDGAEWCWRSKPTEPCFPYYRSDTTITVNADGAILVEGYPLKNSPCIAPAAISLSTDVYAILQYSGTNCK